MALIERGEQGGKEASAQRIRWKHWIIRHAFVLTRRTGFLKDIDICLTDTPNEQGGITHAYFPALAACCAFLEYLTGLQRGRLNGIGWQDVQRWAAEYQAQPAYSADVMRVLTEGFRNSVAHRGIATGIWCDRSGGGQIRRRVTWMLSEKRGNPACQIMEEDGNLVKDPPWPCPYTHRMHIYLRTLSEDLSHGATTYAERLLTHKPLQQSFESAMKTLYPRKRSTNYVLPS